jgi:Ca-activated chloride channel family protein
MNKLLCLRASSALLLTVLLSACVDSTSDNPATPTSAPGQSATTAPVPDTTVAETEPPADIAAVAAPMPSVKLSVAEQNKGETHRARRDIAARKMVEPGAQMMMAPPLPAEAIYYEQPQRERYGKHSDNPIKLVADEPVSTFSIDVDTGSYSNVRRMLTQGQLPPRDAVRVEEMINYFPYRYALPETGQGPFAVHTTLAPAPWNAERVLLRVALKGADLAKQTLPSVNLVFLVDVSGSMQSRDKLPLLQASLKLMVGQMRAQDRISLVTYAGSTVVVMSGKSGTEQAEIVGAIERLHAGGSTAGGAGIKLAYQQARQHFIKDGINRILLATDGDFNVGITDFDTLKQMVERERQSGVSLSTLGFGTGNYNEHLMEQLADVGNGAYSYIDSLMEGKKVLVNEMTSTLATIARDVKIQVEFNPAQVSEYRLIGYENRMLRREDFNNDKVDAGDIGAGHTVTALYELTLVGQKGAVDPLRYQDKAATPPAGHGDELAFIKLRYKQPDAERSTLIELPLSRQALTKVEQADEDFRLAVAVAGFGQLLRGAGNLGSWTYRDVKALAADFDASPKGKRGGDDDYVAYRTELTRLIDVAGALAGNQPLAGKE